MEWRLGNRLLVKWWPWCVILQVLSSCSLVFIITFQDLATAIDEEDVPKLTSIIKEFDSISKLVHLFLALKFNSCSFFLLESEVYWISCNRNLAKTALISTLHFVSITELALTWNVMLCRILGRSHFCWKSRMPWSPKN
jgi:hypothetical protein